VRSSIVHIAIVTEGWLGGLAGEPAQDTPTEADLPTVDDAERLLDRAYQIFNETLPKLTPEQLATPRTFSRRGRTAVLPPWAVLRHIVTNSPSPGGEVASRLRRLGVEPPATDFVFWVFEQIPQQA